MAVVHYLTLAYFKGLQAAYEGVTDRFRSSCQSHSLLSLPQKADLMQELPCPLASSWMRPVGVPDRRPHGYECEVWTFLPWILPCAVALSCLCSWTCDHSFSWGCFSTWLSARGPPVPASSSIPLYLVGVCGYEVPFYPAHTLVNNPFGEETLKYSKWSYLLPVGILAYIDTKTYNKEINTIKLKGAGTQS